LGLLRYLRGDHLLEDRAGFPDVWKESRSLPAPENQLPLWGGYTSSKITPTAALAVADVWAAVRVLADAASSLPLHVYRHVGDARERVTSGKLADVLERPGPGTSQADLISSLMAHLLIHGNAYLGKYRDRGEVSSLALIHPERIRPDLAALRLALWAVSRTIAPDVNLRRGEVHIAPAQCPELAHAQPSEGRHREERGILLVPCGPRGGQHLFRSEHIEVVG